MKPTAKEEGYKFVKWLGNGLAVFNDTLFVNALEVWRSNPNHASYGFHYNNTDWEFCHPYNPEEIKK